MTGFSDESVKPVPNPTDQARRWPLHHAPGAYRICKPAKHPRVGSHTPCKRIRSIWPLRCKGHEHVGYSPGHTTKSPKTLSLQHPQMGNSALEVKEIDSPIYTEDGEETGSEAACPWGGAGSSSAPGGGGGEERKHRPLRVAALLAERENWVANSPTPLAFKCLMASAKEQTRDHAPYMGGMGYGYKAERERWEPHTISLSLALPQTFCYY